MVRTPAGRASEPGRHTGQFAACSAVERRERTVIGIDEWSRRKGSDFGSTIVDLERRLTGPEHKTRAVGIIVTDDAERAAVRTNEGQI
jgi:hypothetical protein